MCGLPWATTPIGIFKSPVQVLLQACPKRSIHFRMSRADVALLGEPDPAHQRTSPRLCKTLRPNHAAQLPPRYNAKKMAKDTSARSKLSIVLANMTPQWNASDQPRRVTRPVPHHVRCVPQQALWSQSTPAAQGGNFGRHRVTLRRHRPNFCVEMCFSSCRRWALVPIRVVLENSPVLGPALRRGNGSDPTDPWGAGRFLRTHSPTAASHPRRGGEDSGPVDLCCTYNGAVSPGVTAAPGTTEDDAV